jgi:type IV pilus assembly protein PilM
MALTLPFLNGAPTRKKRSQVISVDLGSRTTKAVLLERRGEALALTRYALLEAPLYDKKISPEQLGDHLHTVVEALGGTTKYVCVAMGINDTIVRQVELPQIPLDDMRTVLKMNHKAYLQQDLPNHTFDCFIIPARAQNGASPKPGEAVGGNAPKKLKVLVAAAKQQLIADFMQATSISGLQPDTLVPSLVGPINAFQAALPDVYNQETVALVDIGFRHSSICVLDRGELALNRVVNLGGDQITAGLAEARGGIPYAEAEGIKVGMAAEVESDLQTLIMPLGQEIRALLNFFEHQQDRPVSQVYISGGTARSDVIVQMLHAETMVECKSWNPTSFLQLALPSQQAAEIDHISPQLAVAVGTALASY